MNSFKRFLSAAFPQLSGAYRSYRLRAAMDRVAIKLTPFGFRFGGHSEMQAGRFEPDEVELINRELQSATGFIDIGANVGYYVCIARHQGKHVLAFEPVSDNLAHLYANIEANGWSDVEVFPLGLSDAPGIATIYNGATAASLLPGWAGSSNNVHQTIALSTLDIILGVRFAGQSLVIKIDVEGAEYTVLKGAMQTLARQPAPAWLVEICLTEHHPGGRNPHYLSTFEMFWEHGYSAWTVGALPRKIEKADVERWLAQGARDAGLKSGSPYPSYLFKK